MKLLKRIKNFFLQDMYCDDEDILPIQYLDSSSTVNNPILIDLVDGKIQTCED